MKDALTQAELDEIFYGAKPKVEARFYQHEVIDLGASRAAGKKLMRKADYVELKCHRENTHMIRPVNEQDKLTFKAAWLEYQKERDNERHRQVQNLRSEAAGGSEADCAPIEAEGYFKGQFG